IPLALSGATAGSLESTLAQITPDDSLGSENSLVVPLDPQVDQIRGGATRGTNLFHSFSEFNIDEGRAAYFVNPVGIQTIFSRVTGSNPSRLFGTLGVLGDANLFFLNPNGILFGPNAYLNLNGSFVASTASSLLFSDGQHFSATNPEAPPLLTIDVPVPIGLQFEGEQPGAIRVQGSQLQVESGTTLALVGGDISLDNGELATSLGSRIELGAVAGAGIIGVNVNDGLRLSFPDGVARANVSLDNGSSIDIITKVNSDGFIDSSQYVSANAALSSGIAINAQNIDLLNGSRLYANGVTFIPPFDPLPTDITLDATGAVTIEQSSRIRNDSGGDIKIQAQSFSLIDESQLSTQIDASPNFFFFGNEVRAGSISVQADSSVSLKNSSILISLKTTPASASPTSPSTFPASGPPPFDIPGFVPLPLLGGGINIPPPPPPICCSQNVSFNVDGTVNVKGSVGDINISSRSLSLTDGAQLIVNNETLLNRAAILGNINIDISGNVTITGEKSGFFSSIGYSNQVEVGNIFLNTGSLLLSDKAELSTSVKGTADVETAGNIDIDVRGAISLANSHISSIVEVAGSRVGNIRVGNITINANSLSLTDGAKLQTSTNSSGDAGNIQISTDNFVNLTGTNYTGESSGLFASSNSTGKAGLISVETRNFRVADSAVIEARTAAPNTTGTTLLLPFADGSLVSIDLVSLGVEPYTILAGSGGSITVAADTFEATNGGKLITTTLGGGNAGNIILNISDHITLSGTALTSTEQLTQFDPNIASNAGSVSGLFANTEVNSTGAGGGIFLYSNQLTIRDGATVTVGSQGLGIAGDIEATARNIQMDNRAAIIAQTAGTNGGNIKLNVQDLLLMRRNSEISTSAGTARAGGNGGNITINADDGFIIAVPGEDSDIRANAFTGNGGRVEITTQAIFGFQFRAEDTPLSDITASSEFGLDGDVNINTLGVDPSRGLTTLLDEPRDSDVAEGCQASGGQDTVEYFEIGRGGSPHRPDEPLQGDTVIADWIELDAETQSRSDAATATSSSHLDENGQGSGNRTAKASTTTSQLLPPCQSH
ncbi:MAG: filamentous hemagglutinin N-terminal domain-containing protein, partial [Coleofasciculus sp. S288]|nr:filamentous hemagglutinin N-terminal domain-containing protein [Coleofasciculus sp. S288]